MKNLEKAAAVAVRLWDACAPDVQLMSTADSIVAVCLPSAGDPAVECDRLALQTAEGIDFEAMRLVRRHYGGDVMRVDLVLIFSNYGTETERRSQLLALIEHANEFWPAKPVTTETEDATEAEGDTEAEGE